jgi:3-phosphoshikimate 1-carboxyvinyltransferase
VKYDNLPGDKSISHRSLLVACLGKTPAELINLNLGGAVTPLTFALEKLGVRFETSGPGIEVIPPSSFAPCANTALQLGPSSAAARMLIGVLAGLGVSCIVDGDHVLRCRPMQWIVEPLNEMGAAISYIAAKGRLPVRIRPSKFVGGTAELQVVSAQAASSLLLAAYAAGVPIKIRKVASARDHTERMLSALGTTVIVEEGSIEFKPATRRREIGTWRIAADPSAAAYLAAAHVLSGRSKKLQLSNICLNPTRLGFFDFLSQCGATVDMRTNSEVFGEPVGTIEVSAAARLRPPCFWGGKSRIHSMIDEVPLAAAVAAVAGPGTFTDCEELVFKETNRLMTTQQLLSAFACKSHVGENGIAVFERVAAKPLGNSVVVDSFGDHRIAMSAAVLACALRVKATILDGSCVVTSFPNFAAAMTQCGFPVHASGKHLEVGK